MTEERTESDVTSQLSGHFDTVSKQIIQKSRDECIQFFLGTTDAQTINVIETEQSVVKWY